jgi:hypothetical protein
VSETKEEIAAERDTLREENERLRAQLQASGLTGRGYAPAQQFVLSEGDRQELAARGAVNVNGVLTSRDDVRAMLGDGQQDVDLGDGDVDPALQPLLEQQGARAGVAGVDYVWPSVQPGKIDPAVAGTPGISGPSA